VAAVPLLVELVARPRLIMSAHGVQSARERIGFVDSHTAGEPTRLILSGVPDLGTGSVAEQLQQLRAQDWLRRCVIHEPRGHEAIVGAVLCEPLDPTAACGVIFINNTGYLGMCGHGTIGVAVTLHALGRIGLGRHTIETPVGRVEVDLLTPNRVAIDNVRSERVQRGVSVEVGGIGCVRGDVAWGGNWFFLAEQSPCAIEPSNIRHLLDAGERVREALVRSGITGNDGGEIDHIEFFQTSETPGVDSRNFVLCPGGAYDRSPCGTGTSAKLACLAADGKLAPGETWVQESVLGGIFEGSYRISDERGVMPTIIGEAFVTAEGFLLRQPGDPFAEGMGR
jgi:4-hydroxyproline epimerase